MTGPPGEDTISLGLSWIGMPMAGTNDTELPSSSMRVTVDVAFRKIAFGRSPLSNVCGNDDTLTHLVADVVSVCLNPIMEHSRFDSL